MMRVEVGSPQPCEVHRYIQIVTRKGTVPHRENGVMVNGVMVNDDWCNGDWGLKTYFDPGKVTVSLNAIY